MYEKNNEVTTLHNIFSRDLPVINLHVNIHLLIWIHVFAYPVVPFGSTLVADVPFFANVDLG